jgi:hypothetical protein
VRLTEPIFHTRTTPLRAEQGYGVGRTALVKRWTILDPGTTATIHINGAPVLLPDMDGRTFDVPSIRAALREAIPMSWEENQLCWIDSNLYGTQLNPTPWYRYFPIPHFFDLIFTGELCVTFALRTVDGSELPDRVQLEEEYALSEPQLLQRLARGETVEQIRADCQEQGTSFSV